MLALLSLPVMGQAKVLVPSTNNSGPLKFSIIKTADAETLEAMTYSGGNWLKPVKMNFMAVLVRHGNDEFLFDSGLGKKIDAQYDEEMPWWLKPVLSYQNVITARYQLDAASNEPIHRIILSHVHWDHGSGVHDFPNAEIWAPTVERKFINNTMVGPTMPSQFTKPNIKWRDLRMTDAAYLTYPRSLDWYGDGSVVFVPMPGHTPGSIGMFLTTVSGHRYFFCGDVVWRADAIKNARPKFYFSSLIADDDGKQTQASIRQLSDLSRQHPEILVVPAHDASVHDKLGYFPKWVE
jgi:glyoxylase-like metal-dependent hydrolase (beta-lactamase superfamily II)